MHPQNRNQKNPLTRGTRARRVEGLSGHADYHANQGEVSGHADYSACQGELHPHPFIIGDLAFFILKQPHILRGLVSLS